MTQIGERANLKILREKSFGLYLDGGDLGEVLLPHREVPKDNVIGGFLEVFIYTDSEDRPVATLMQPKGMPGDILKLTCVAVTDVGAFMDWGLPKELLVPFREQRTRMVEGKSYLVRITFDPVSQRIYATTRINRHLNQAPPTFRIGEAVDLIIFEKSDLGYKAAINQTHSGLIFHEAVFTPLRQGERLTGYIKNVRPDGKIDLSLQPEGRKKVVLHEDQILRELSLRGGFWAIGDHSSAEEIHDELGISKRTFKQVIGALFRSKRITIEANGIRLTTPPHE